MRTAALLLLAAALLLPTWLALEARPATLQGLSFPAEGRPDVPFFRVARPASERRE